MSEVIKRVHSDGPQHLSVRGGREVVIVAAEEYRRLKGHESGQALIDALARFIAATASVHGLTVVTRNASDLVGAGVAILNPWG